MREESIIGCAWMRWHRWQSIPDEWEGCRDVQLAVEHWSSNMYMMGSPSIHLRRCQKICRCPNCRTGGRERVERKNQTTSIDRCSRWHHAGGGCRKYILR